MTQKIPREILWKDKTIEELLDIPLFNVLHDAFIDFDAEPMIFPLDKESILNEVGYQVTWLCFESRFGMEPDMDQFEREVYAHTGLSDHAKTVMSLVEAVIKLVTFPPLNISKRTKNKLAQMNRNNWCRRFVDSFVKRALKEGFVFSEQFQPVQRDYIVTKEEKEEKEIWFESCMRTEPSIEEQRDNVRRFTMDEIVNYAKENTSLDESRVVQLMLFSLLVYDGTKEEREKVNSIPAYIRNRDKTESTHVEHHIDKVEAKIEKVDQLNAIMGKGATIKR